MGNKSRILAVIAGAAVVGGIAVTAAFGAHRAAPGVTATTITIGGTFPLTGPAALYKTIPAAENAYFAYVNDHGGVNGRKIDFKILDDGYDPSRTVPLTQQLVEQDKVFAVFGSLGTAPCSPPGATSTAGRSRRSSSRPATPTGASRRRSSRGRSAGSPTTRARASLRQVHRREHAEREGRRALPERRIRQELLRRLACRSRRQEGEHRRRRVV